jgi:hypothetical protein
MLTGDEAAKAGAGGRRGAGRRCHRCHRGRTAGGPRHRRRGAGGRGGQGCGRAGGRRAHAPHQQPVSPAPASSPSDTASHGLGRAGAAGAATTSGPNTSAAALSTTARVARCCRRPAARGWHSRLMRRGTPRARRWMRLPAPRRRRAAAPVCPATASRCAMYWGLGLAQRHRGESARSRAGPAAPARGGPACRAARAGRSARSAAACARWFPGWSAGAAAPAPRRQVLRLVDDQHAALAGRVARSRKAFSAST